MSVAIEISSHGKIKSETVLKVKIDGIISETRPN